MSDCRWHPGWSEYPYGPHAGLNDFLRHGTRNEVSFRSMASKYFFVLSAVLLVLGFVALFSNFHGSVTMSGAVPVSGASFDICGSAKGALPMVAVVLAITSVLVFIVGVVRAFAYESAAAVGDRAATAKK